MTRQSAASRPRPRLAVAGSEGTIHFADDDLNEVRGWLRSHGLESRRGGWRNDDGTRDGAIYFDATPGRNWRGTIWIRTA